VAIGYIDPAMVERVIPHPERSMEMWAIVVDSGEVSKDNWIKTRGKLIYRIIREAEPFVIDTEDGQTVVAVENEGMLVTAQQTVLQPWEVTMLANFNKGDYDGDVFFTRVNSVSNQPRGYSDLMQVADWIDQVDETLFALAEREQYAGYFSWDVTLVGATPDAVKERAKVIRTAAPKKGSVNVHNESEVWVFNAPDLKQPGSIETFRALLGFVLGGVGYPVHWFAFGDDANRATAVAQGSPTEKSLEHDQGTVAEMLSQMCTFARDQAVIAGTVSVSDSDQVDSIHIELPAITMRDMSSVSTLIGPVSAALVTTVDANLITRETAIKAWVAIMAQLGIETDVAEELEALAGEFDEAIAEWLTDYGQRATVVMAGNGRE
jgi:hypothetical protein